MKIFARILFIALAFSLALPAAMAEKPAATAQARSKAKAKARKTLRRKKARKARKKVRKKAHKKARKAAKKTPPKTLSGPLEIIRGKKGALKQVSLTTEDGESVRIVLNAKGRALAKLGGSMSVTGTVYTRKGVQFMRVTEFQELPEPAMEPEVEAVPAVADPAPKAPVMEKTPAPAADMPAGDDMPADGDDMPADDDDMPADDDPPVE